jgi:hypothetical protein
MERTSVDYFGRIPNDILHIILPFVDIKDSFSLLLVSKRFYNLIKTDERWKSLCLRAWENYSEEGRYDLTWAQEKSGKDWFWFAKCFANERVAQSRFAAKMFGLTPRKNGSGILVWSEWMEIGTFVSDLMYGYGTRIHKSGIRYEGKCCKGAFHEHGSITYPDGIRYEGNWNMGNPGCIDCFILTN